MLPKIDSATIVLFGLSCSEYTVASLLDTRSGACESSPPASISNILICLGSALATSLSRLYSDSNTRLLTVMLILLVKSDSSTTLSKTSKTQSVVSLVDAVLNGKLPVPCACLGTSLP